MSTVVSRQITFRADDGLETSYTQYNSNYQGTTSSDMVSNHEISQVGDWAMLQSKSTSILTSQLNSTAMNVLYPNAVAHPIKADIHEWICVGYSFGGSGKGYHYFDGTDVFNWSHKPGMLSDYDATKESLGITSSAVLNSTRNSNISFGLMTTKTTLYGCSCILNGYITLYFNRYDFTASSGTGISSASVSSATGFDGDSITFSCTVSDGYQFDGWYNGSTKVSSSQSYSMTVSGADVSLTAVATEIPSFIYIKQNGSWVRAVALYKKENGVWVNQSTPPTGYSKILHKSD